MASKDELDSLRAEVRRRQRAANAKISRLRSNGVDISGTSYDVRRDLAKSKSYTRSQLRSYIDKLNSFNSRQNSFHAGAAGIIRGDKLRAYRVEENRFNAKARKHYSGVKGVILPGNEMTVEQRDTDMRPTRVKAAGEAVIRPYDPVRRRVSNIANEEALEKLTMDMRRRNTKTYLPEELAKQREQFEQTMKDSGDDKLISRARELSDSQFDTLWNYTNFATDSGLLYEEKKLMATRKDRASDDISEQMSRSIMTKLEWAHALPATNAPVKPKRVK